MKDSKKLAKGAKGFNRNLSFDYIQNKKEKNNEKIVPYTCVGGTSGTYGFLCRPGSQSGL
jgi:hypothetical protein